MQLFISQYWKFVNYHKNSENEIPLLIARLILNLFICCHVFLFTLRDTLNNEDASLNFNAFMLSAILVKVDYFKFDFEKYKTENK